MYKLLKVTAVLIILVVLVIGIGPVQLKAADSDTVIRPEGWTDETHGKGAEANYSLLFPDNKVQRIDIIISPENYRTMEDNLNGLDIMNGENPIYVTATVKFNNLMWQQVGIRYKGQSTLSGPRQSRKHKYPFRLNFDKFEDDYPEIDNQRFYGFDELIFSNNWYDPSFLRDKVCSDIFRNGGIPTPRSAFYRVYMDTGSGPVYWGLYTMFEDPSDKMLDTQFENDDGNLYKGQQAPGADLRTFDQQGFEKKTNEDENDWSDIQALVAALNAPRDDAAKWRSDLESVFNVNSFLRWLAINTTVVNFDNYGWVTKNYYLYQDLSDNGRLIFLPWDFNLSLSSTSPWGWIRPASLSLDEVNNNWPLIRFLMDDPVYRNIYHYEMQTGVNGCFNEAAVTAEMRRLHEMIRPYVVGPEGETREFSYLNNGESQFNQALADLLNHVTSRHTAVKQYLSTINISPIPTPTPVVGTRGDANEDGSVNSTDYTIIKRHILGITSLTGTRFDNADVNNDDIINSTDYTLIKRYVLGIITEFPSV
ncbi:MAG: CotH kinase family protein [Bacillota bacterium]